MTDNEAVEIIWERHMDCEVYRLQFDSYPDGYDSIFDQAILIAAQAFEEVQQYRKIGTVEECQELESMVTQEKKDALGKIVDEWIEYTEIGTVEECKKAVKEEDALKFYYCESEDDYYIGKRVGNFYYARYGKTGFTWFMSRYLPWGEHVIAPNTLWKEYTYPSEPKEIPFFEWLQGFVKKYCGGTVEECREAVEKQKPKKPVLRNDNGKLRKSCPVCGCFFSPLSRSCPKCGQAILQENKDD